MTSSKYYGEDSSPQNLGYRLPAEWEQHAGTWIAWPHNRETWTCDWDRVECFFSALLAALLDSEPAHVIVEDRRSEDHVRRLLDGRAASGDVSFHHFMTNDAWCRDYGATFVRRMTDNNHLPDLVAIDWGYNAWGGKYPPFDADNAIARQMAQVAQAPCVSGSMVLEGGAIDVDGCGILMTNESCLLNANRNPDMDRGQIELRLQRMLGVERIVWLADGLVGDDTDGHVDQLARFVAPGRVIAVTEDNRADPNFASLAENQRRLARDSRLEVVEIPQPPAQYQGLKRLPASYANFYITNKSVLVPQYAHPRDENACAALAREFPDRRIVGLDCRDIIAGLGAIHCLTMQMPAA